jgi:hypothetical protein
MTATPQPPWHLFDLDRDLRSGRRGGLAATQKVPLPRPRPATNTAKQVPAPIAATAQLPSKTAPLPQKRPPANSAGLSSFAQANVGLRGAMFETRAFFKPLARPAAGPFAVAPTAALLGPTSLR